MAASEPSTPADSGRSALGRKVDPSGKHALFSAPPTAARDQLLPGNQKEGRDALFSTGPRQPGTVVIACSSCLVRTRASLVDLGIRLISISAWIPGRTHSHWMRCPACHQHTWCRIGWNE
jgi:hypothetical protein